MASGSRGAPAPPENNCTFFFWHVFVEGLPPRTYYTWRADGPNDTQQTGCRFNPRKELVDPWTGEFVRAVRGSDRDCERIHLGLLDEVHGLVGVG
jgi:pullulanase/glycogen debranching enzyme